MKKYARCFVGWGTSHGTSSLSSIGHRGSLCCAPWFALRLLCILVLLSLTAACSGSSSSGALSDSGNLILSVTPREIPVGTLSFVDLEFFDVGYDDLEDKGLTVKFVLSEAVSYVAGSATLVTDSRAQQITPSSTDPVPDVGSDSLADRLGESRLSFLVFDLTDVLLDGARRGRIQFDLMGVEREPSANIRVDLDRGVGDPFDPENAFFDVEAEAELAVTEE